MTTVPPVDTGTFGEALEMVQEAGLKAEVTEFAQPLPSGYWLSHAGVGDQDPEPGTRVPRGSTVRLNMKDGANPIPSVATPIRHPAFAVVPNVVGLPEPVAARRLGNGLWPRIVSIEPLTAERSARGLFAFVVASQDPPPGTRLPYIGRRTERGLRVSVVRLTLRVP
jgi:beta-lactam-binding protein with PASTA domain